MLSAAHVLFLGSAEMSDLFLADTIAVIHALFVGFVVVGLLVIVVGALCRFGWVRNFWFRLIHLLCIGIVAMEDTVGWECPLTRWERDLRLVAGAPAEDISFMAQLARSTIYHQWDPSIFPKLNIGFAVLVFLTFVLAPPRWPWKKGQFVFHGVLIALVVGLTYVLFGLQIALAVAAGGVALLGILWIWTKAEPPGQPQQPAPAPGNQGDRFTPLSALPPSATNGGISKDGPGKDAPETVKTHEANGS
jgi:hypothetical protein